MIDYVSPGTFRFRDNFVDITDEQITMAIQVVNAEFSGVYSLWGILPQPERDAKRELCINYLVAWSLANTYPENTVNVGSMGTMPLTMKIADRVHIHYKDTVRQGSGVLDMLTNNAFGMHALMMIQGAPENYMVFV